MTLAMILLLAANGVHLSSQPDLVGLFNASISVAVTDARSAAEPGSGCGPLMVDVESFLGAAAQLGEELTASAFTSGIAQRFRNATVAEAVECAPSNGPCWVAGNGMFVRLELLRRIAGEYEILISSEVTEFRGPGESALCGRQLRLFFEYSGSKWVLKRRGPGTVC